MQLGQLFQHLHNCSLPPLVEMINSSWLKDDAGLWDLDR